MGKLIPNSEASISLSSWMGEKEISIQRSCMKLAGGYFEHQTWCQGMCTRRAIAKYVEICKVKIWNGLQLSKYGDSGEICIKIEKL